MNNKEFFEEITEFFITEYKTPPLTFKGQFRLENILMKLQEFEEIDHKLVFMFLLLKAADN